MSITDKLTRPVRHEGDPAVIETGPSSRNWADSTGKGLGWFSLALGAAELFGAKKLTKTLGVEGHETLVRAFGVREILAGVTSLSADEKVGIQSRVAGDALDIAALGVALATSRKKGNVGLALAFVVGATVLDAVTAAALQKRHGRRGPTRDYSDRSGWPKGRDKSLGAAADYSKPADMAQEPEAAKASPTDGSTSPASRQLEQIG